MKTIKAYLFSELSEEAQKGVIKKRRFTWHSNYGWWNPIKEQYIEKAENLGYEGVDSTFVLNYSQGDGACITAQSIDIQKWITRHGKYNEWRALWKAADYLKMWVEEKSVGCGLGYTYVGYDFYGDVSDKADGQILAMAEAVKAEIQELNKAYYCALQEFDEATWSDDYGRQRLMINTSTYYDRRGNKLPRQDED